MGHQGADDFCFDVAVSWDVEDMCNWLKRIDIPEAVAYFRDYNVDGRYLMKQGGRSVEIASKIRKLPKKKQNVLAKYLKSFDNELLAKSNGLSPIGDALRNISKRQRGTTPQSSASEARPTPSRPPMARIPNNEEDFADDTDDFTEDEEEEDVYENRSDSNLTSDAVLPPLPLRTTPVSAGMPTRLTCDRKGPPPAMPVEPSEDSDSDYIEPNPSPPLPPAPPFGQQQTGRKPAVPPPTAASARLPPEETYELPKEMTIGTARAPAGGRRPPIPPSVDLPSTSEEENYESPQVNETPPLPHGRGNQPPPKLERIRKGAPAEQAPLPSSSARQPVGRGTMFPLPIHAPPTLPTKQASTAGRPPALPPRKEEEEVYEEAPGEDRITADSPTDELLYEDPPDSSPAASQTQPMPDPDDDAYVVPSEENTYEPPVNEAPKSDKRNRPCTQLPAENRLRNMPSSGPRPPVKAVPVVPSSLPTDDDMYEPPLNDHPPDPPGRSCPPLPTNNTKKSPSFPGQPNGPATHVPRQPVPPLPKAHAETPSLPCAVPFKQQPPPSKPPSIPDAVVVGRGSASGSSPAKPSSGRGGNGEEPRVVVGHKVGNVGDGTLKLALKNLKPAVRKRTAQEVNEQLTTSGFPLRTTFEKKKQTDPMPHMSPMTDGDQCRPTATETHLNSCLSPPPPPVRATEGSTSKDILDKQPWFFGNIGRTEATNKVNSINKEGAFLVRRSEKGGASQPFTLCLVHNGQTFNVQIRRRDDQLFALGSPKTGENVYSNVIDLINFHKNNAIELSRDGRRFGEAKLCVWPNK